MADFHDLATIEEEKGSERRSDSVPSTSRVMPSRSMASSVGLSIAEERNRKMKDGPWAWVVCICSFMVQVWVIGVLHAYGVFYLAFIEEFKCPNSTAGNLR